MEKKFWKQGTKNTEKKVQLESNWGPKTTNCGPGKESQDRKVAKLIESGEKRVEDSDEEGSHTGLTQEMKQTFIEETPRNMGRKRLRGKEKEEEQGTPAKSARISVKNLVDEIEKKEQEARKIKEKEGKKEIKANAKIARGSKFGNYKLGNCKLGKLKKM